MQLDADFFPTSFIIIRYPGSLNIGQVCSLTALNKRIEQKINFTNFRQKKSVFFFSTKLIFLDKNVPYARGDKLFELHCTKLGSRCERLRF